MKILFIGAGGTIDKDYARRAGTYNFTIGEPAVKRILHHLHPEFEFEVQSVVKKDSLDMTELDRQLLFDACRHAHCSKIIITHGTDTMHLTAKRLSELSDKTIILVGASKPERFADSDAAINIGTALGAISLLPKGIFIAMHGRVWEWSKVRKQEDGHFREHSTQH